MKLDDFQNVELENAVFDQKSLFENVGGFVLDQPNDAPRLSFHDFDEYSQETN